MSDPLISVVVRTRNRAELLASCLESIVHQSWQGDYEVVVVDNDSKDETPELVRRLAESSSVPLRYCHEPKLGVVPPLMRGIAESRGQAVAFCDDDQRAHPDWLAHLEAAWRSTGSGYLGGSILLDLPETDLSLGVVRRQLLGEHTWQGETRPVHGKEVPSMGNLFITRAILDDVGPFDLEAVSGGEDTDYTARARRAGHVVVIVPDAVVYHVIPPHRLSDDYFCWISMRWGNNLARRDRVRGRGVLMGLAVARLGQTALVHFPAMLLKLFKYDMAGSKDSQCLIWRAWGYFRTSLALVAPNILPQKGFNRMLEVGWEREIEKRAGGGA